MQDREFKRIENRPALDMKQYEYLGTLYDSYNVFEVLDKYEGYVNFPNTVYYVEYNVEKTHVTHFYKDKNER